MRTKKDILARLKDIEREMEMEPHQMGMLYLKGQRRALRWIIEMEK